MILGEGLEGHTAMSNDWVLGILLNLLISVLVWGTVITGLILIVRDKVKDDDLAKYH